MATFACDICGRKIAADVMNLWWTMHVGERQSGSVPASHVFLACQYSGELCGHAADRRAESVVGVARPLPGFINLAGLHYSLPRLERDYIWPLKDLEFLRALNRQMMPATTRSTRTTSQWEDNDPVGIKRQRLVKWLMRSPRLVPLEKAKLIASRKYQ